MNRQEIGKMYCKIALRMECPLKVTEEEEQAIREAYEIFPEIYYNMVSEKLKLYGNQERALCESREGIPEAFFNLVTERLRENNPKRRRVVY